MTISGQVTATLSAPTSGTYNGILFFGNRTGCSTKGSCNDQINGGSTAILNGALYFASDEIMITGSNASGYMMLVADKIYINGNSNFGNNGNPFDGITVSVSPSAATLAASHTQQFTATVGNTANPAVTWSISPSVGSISTAGLYTAPSSITAQQTVTVTATSQADTSKTGTATITLTPPVVLTAPTITFSVPSKTYGVAPFTVAATSNSAGALAYSVVSGPATISGSTVTITGVGTVVLQASQAASGNYTAGTATATFTVSAEAQTITFAAPASPVTYGVSPIALSASASSGLAVTLTVASGPGTVAGSTLTVTGPGTIVVAANQAGNADYAAAQQVTQSIVVNQAVPVVAWATPGSIPYGTALSSAQLDATASFAGSPVSGTFVYTPAAGTVLPVGTQTLSANFTPANSADYASPASTSVTIVVNPAISVNVSPATVTLQAGQTQPFNAVVSNTSNTGVTWSISPAGAGFISSSGVYTAPASITSQQTVMITATSQADGVTSGSATITLVLATGCGPSEFEYQRVIVIDHTKVPNTDQVNFPFLFSVTDPLLVSQSHGGHLANENGYDVIFSSDPEGVNRLSYELETYNPASGQMVAWVKVPTVSHSADTVIYILYGNASITTSQQNAAGVWDSNYQGVWHLPGGATLSTADSTANGNNGTNIGATPASTGPIFGAASFNPSAGSYIDIGNLGNFYPQGTISFWLNAASIYGYPNVFTTSYGGGNDAVRFEEDQVNDFTVVTGGGTYQYLSGTMQPNTWYHAAFTWNTGTQFPGVRNGTGYLDGAPVFFEDSVSFPSQMPDVAIGSGFSSSEGRLWDGLLSEVRLSNLARSADWTATEYNNQSSPSTFSTLNPEGTALLPAAVSLYASQSQQFILANICNTGLTWSIPAGAPGAITGDGLYTAPATIPLQTSVPVTATSQLGTVIGQSIVTLIPPAFNPTISLVAAVQPPYVTGATEQFSAMVKNQDGTPFPGAPVTFNVSGANNASGTSTTNASGVATFTYTGVNSGKDTIVATAPPSVSTGGASVSSNQVEAHWIVPVQSISTTTVTGQFFSTNDESGQFSTPSTATPAFVQNFPNINFNPYIPTPGSPNPAVGTGTLPFTDVTTDQNGNYTGTIVAQGNGYQAGVGALGIFQAVFTGSFTVASAGDVVFDVYHDDGFVMGIGNGATRVTGNQNSSFNLPSLSYFYGLPAIEAWNTGAGIPDYDAQVTVNFPAPGTYPFEIDYTQRDAGSPLVLQLTATSSASGVPATGSLTLSPGSVNSLPQGGQQTFTVAAVDGAGAPVANVVIGLNVSGADYVQLSATTNASGVATFPVLTNVMAGTDSVQAIAFIDGMATYSNVVSVPFTGAAGPTGGSGGSSTLSITISTNSPVTLPSTLQLTGTATDTSLPAGQAPAVAWSQLSGPGTVTFSDPAQTATMAAFSHAGAYVLQLSASDSFNSGSASVQVVVDPVPAVPQGWIGSPLNGSAARGIVPVTVAPGITLTSGVLSYYPSNNPNNPVVLNADTTGSGQIGIFDTTMLANGSYWLSLTATDSTGDTEQNLVLVTVTGNYKPGRVTATITDLVVPATGLPINIQRTYDSLNAGASGDFGYGWNLGINVNLSVDPQGDVTFTLGGQRRTFYLAPQSLEPFLPYYDAAFMPEPGFHGSLTDSAPGCVDDFDFLLQDGSLWFCLDGGQYNPPGYIYTDPNGTSYTISAAGSLQSITDRSGNGLIITPAGITSSTGLKVPFKRDAQNRIYEIDDPQGNPYSYTYDASGNLASVTYPATTNTQTCPGASATNTSQYSYLPDADHPNGPAHYYAGGTDARCNPLPVTAYYDSTNDNGNAALDGRLLSVTNVAGTTSYAYTLSTTSVINGVSVPNTGVTTVTNPDGGTATMIYDSYGMLLTSTDPLNLTTTNTYDTQYNLLSTTDPLGHTTSYTYDQNGNKTSTTYPATATSTNTTSTTQYNQYSEPTQTTDELGNVRLFNYDDNYNPQSVTDSIGTLASFQFNTNQTLASGAIGFDISVTPASASNFQYDANGNMIARTDALGRTTSYVYNSLGQKTSQTTPTPSSPTGSSASTTSYTYDQLGNLLQTAAPLSRTTSSTFDGNSNKISETDARGNVTSYQYDALNRLIETDYPDGTKATKTYDFRNNVIKETDQNGNLTLHAYDLAGRQTSVTRGYGTSSASTTSYAYDNAGRKITETDAQGHTTSYTYDAAGNLTAIAGVQGNFTYTYDNARNRVAQTDGRGNTTHFAYDARKRLTITTYPDTHTTVNAYDGPGNLASVTDQNQNVVQYQYDAANQLVSVIQTASPNTGNNANSYGYDPLGNLTALTDENQHTTQNLFDLYGEPVQKTLPDQTLFETRTYDNNGNLQTLTHFNGVTTTYAYDQLNRLLSRTTPGEPAVSFTYTATGKYLTSTAGDGTVNYSYDSLDRLVTKATPEGTLSYGYNAAGDVASVASNHANGVSVSYAYDELNRLSTVTDGNLPGNQVTTYAYDAASNVGSVTYPNGVQSAMTYDALNRISGLAASNTGYLYQRDSAGNLTGATELNGRMVAWSFDGIYRLTNETISSDPSKNNGSSSYTLDPVGNRLAENTSLPGRSSGSFGYNADDEVNTETYDSNGNTTRLANGNTFAYDAENHLVSMNGGAVSIVYDGDGNRVSKTVGGVTTQYLVDDLNPTGYVQVVEELQGGAVTRQYTYGLQRISQRQFVSNGWTVSFYGYDGGGNVRNLTNTAGAITDEYEYDAFGNSFTKQGTTPNNYLYRGEQYDSDLGLYYLRARYYNADTGRFLSRDPEDNKLYDQAAFHKYLYASGNPVNRIDPRGRADLVETGFALEKATIRTDLIAGAIGCGASLGFTVAEAMLAQDYSFGFLNPDGSISGAGTAGNAAAIAGCLTTMFSRIPAASKLGVLAGWVGCIAGVVQVIQDIQQIEKDTNPVAVENDGKKATIDLISGDFGCALTIAGAVGAF